MNAGFPNQPRAVGPGPESAGQAGVSQDSLFAGIEFRLCACNVEGIELKGDSLLKAELLFYLEGMHPPKVKEMLELYFTIPRCLECPSHFECADRHFCICAPHSPTEIDANGKANPALACQSIQARGSSGDSSKQT